MVSKHALVALVLSALGLVLTTVNIAKAQKLKPQAQIGINLAGIVDWNTELPLKDVFKMSRNWISQRQGQSWGKGPELTLDEHGYVTQLDKGCYVETPMRTIDGGHYPSGRYVLTYQGKGDIEFWGAARILDAQPGRIVADVDARRGTIWLRIKSVDPKDHIRDMHLMLESDLDTYEQNPWTSHFLRRWKGFATLRYMNFMATNRNHIRTWEDRPKRDDANWTDRGLPLEIMCDLANRLKIDPWFCIPHEADDNYVRQFVKQADQLLDPNLKMYIEYSNEVWNGIFQANRYAAKKGQEMGLADKPWEAAWSYYSVRNIEIFKIVADVLGDKRQDRAVRVLASQAANSWVSNRICEYRGAHQYADALAIAPYISMNINTEQAPQVVSQSVTQILDHVENDALAECIKWMQDNKKVAEKYHLKLIAYEGGQHLVGIQGAENNDALTEKLQAVNRHPRMARIYKKYYDAWAKAGGGVFATFISTERWHKWGSWGLVEFYDSNPADYPKMQATLQWAKEHGQKVNMR
ncbi:MAG: hypothetical protein CMJ19_12845 [Phycisphaeraceae bacterium]|nr:hypothetical protein [Phycisphaeraceae bacterium]